MEQKLKRQEDPANLRRNIGKMRDAFAEDGIPIPDSVGGQRDLCLVYEDPMGQPFNETRTDLEATIAGHGVETLVVVEVIKPIIRAFVKGEANESSKIVQKGIVIVEPRKEQP
ncbi:MAG: hypothetical protein NTW96_25625 [Planctomycetia bacterium]|nr:hypothetical protein [Planctomycetia bacterium]